MKYKYVRLNLSKELIYIAPHSDSKYRVSLSQSTFIGFRFDNQATYGILGIYNKINNLSLKLLIK